MSLLNIEGTGILNLFFKWLLNKGKIVLNSYSLSLVYRYENLNSYIHHFILELQFINNSGLQVIVKDFSVRFYDGAEWHKLMIGDSNISFAEKIEAKSPKNFRLELFPQTNNIDVPLINIGSRTAHLEFLYKIFNKNHSEFINEIKLIEDENYPTWVGF